MTEKTNNKSETRSWLERLGDALSPEPQNRDELIEVLHDAEERQLINNNALAMMEGVLQISMMQAGDIMIPRSQMIVIHESDSLHDLLPIVIESQHSRFPVIGDDRDEIIGILLAKDLLPSLIESAPHQPQKSRFKIRELLRPVIFVPESKRLDALLQDFRINRNHMAIVVDEYGGVAGLVTIEDILEEIVGDIADEYDTDEENFIKQVDTHIYIIKGLTPITDFNDYFSAQLPDDECETMGGLISQTLGHLPKIGDVVELQSFKLRILSADNRRIRLLQLQLPSDVIED